MVRMNEMIKSAMHLQDEIEVLCYEIYSEQSWIVIECKRNQLYLHYGIRSSLPDAPSNFATNNTWNNCCCDL